MINSFALGQVGLSGSKSAADDLMNDYLTGNSHKLNNVEVLTKRFTVQNIIDSILTKADANYVKAPAFHLKFDISINTSNDTLFDCRVDAYLVKPLDKMRQYLLAVQELSAYTIRTNKLTKNQSLKLLPVDGYPQTLLVGFLSDLKKQLLKNEAYFVCQPGNGDSAFVIVIKNRFVPSSIFAKRDVSEEFPQACSFRIITVNRRDWALTNSYAVVIEASQTQHDVFVAASSYEELSKTVRDMLKDGTRKHSSSIIRYKKNALGYYVDDFLFENSFYLASRKLLGKTSNPEGSVYCYWMHNFIPMDVYPDKRKLFSVTDMLESP